MLDLCGCLVWFNLLLFSLSLLFLGSIVVGLLFWVNCASVDVWLLMFCLIVLVDLPCLIRLF